MHYNTYSPYQETGGSYPRRGRGERSRQQPPADNHNPSQHYGQYPLHSQPYSREPEYHNPQQPQGYRYDEEVMEPNDYAEQDYSDQFGENSQQKHVRKIQLFIGGIPPNINESTHLLTQKCSRVSLRTTDPCPSAGWSSIRLLVQSDSPSGQPRGFGFVTFVNHSDTMKLLNKRVFMSGKEVAVWLIADRVQRCYLQKRLQY